MVANSGRISRKSSRAIIRPFRLVSCGVFRQKSQHRRADVKVLVGNPLLCRNSVEDEDSSGSSYPTSIGSVLESDCSLSLFDVDIGGETSSYLAQTSLGFIGDEDAESNAILPNDTDSESDLGSEEGRIAFGHFVQHVINLEHRAMAAKRMRPVLDSFDLEGVAKFIKRRPGCRILVLTGAGISVAAGIPDFRSPGTGLYSRLQQYRLPMPSAIFDLEYFPSRPEPFYTLAKELWPGNYVPTQVHFFIMLLHEKGLLLRNYTQNIDGLEIVAGLPQEALVEVHGTFATAKCLTCRRRHASADVKKVVFADQIPRCECGGLIKPDVVFFGEQLPDRFFQMARGDFNDAELLIVLGTSLQVAPFSSLPEQCDDQVPRLLINNEVVGEVSPCRPGGFDFSEYNYRDAKAIGDCQEGVLQLAELLGWKQELEDRHRQAQLAHPSTPSIPAFLPNPLWPSEQV